MTSWRGRAFGIGLVAWMLAAAGCATAPQPATLAPLTARFFLESRPGETGVPVKLPQSEVTIVVGAKPVITEYDIVDAAVVQVELGRCLRVQLTPAAARDLYRLSVSAVGRRLVLSLDERFLGARRIDGAMTDGTVMIFVEAPDAQLPDLVARLKQTSATLAKDAKTSKTK